MSMDITIIQAHPPLKCEICGMVEELRPYGPNGESICFDCGMKDELTTIRSFLGCDKEEAERVLALKKAAIHSTRQPKD